MWLWLLEVSHLVHPYEFLLPYHSCPLHILPQPYIPYQPSSPALHNHQTLESRFFDDTLVDLYDTRLGVTKDDDAGAYDNVGDVKRGRACPMLCLPPLGDQVSLWVSWLLRIVLRYYTYL